MVQTPIKAIINSLEIPDTVLLQVTLEQFTQLAAINRDMRLERTAEGELIVNPPAGSESGMYNSRLTGELYFWNRAKENIGVVFDSSAGFTLPNGAVRAPDASWISRERWESLTPKEKKGFAPLCPDFVIELRSETDKLSTLQAKMQEYIENGARLGWLIDPQSKQVEIYRVGQEVEILENPSELSGEDVLLGFTLNLKRVFD
jgi:Uma2 family endonuclease